MRQAHHVVFVSTYVARFNRVLTQIVPSVQAVWQVYDIVQRTR